MKRNLTFDQLLALQPRINAKLDKAIQARATADLKRAGAKKRKHARH